MKRVLKAFYDALPFKQQLFSLLRPLRPPERLYKHLHFRGIVHVPVPPGGGFRMRHWGYIIENELFWRGLQGWERISMDLWARLCRNAGGVIDVGANTGVYTLLARSVNPTAGVASLEPIARVFRKLEANLQLNGYADVRAFCIAASDHDGTAIIYDQPSEHVLSVSLNKDFNTRDKDLVATPIPVRTLDSLVDELGWRQVDVVKIDAESHEPEVLAGFRRTLERCRPALLVEVLDDGTARRVEEHLAGLGYVYYDIDEVTAPRQVPSLGRSAHFNFLVCLPATARALGLPCDR